ncbi:MAG: serine protease [Gemmataceae bacterium]
MISALVLSLWLGPFPVVESKDFTKQQQVAVLRATVRIQNRTNATQGTGVIVGRKARQRGDKTIYYAYILTASHLVEGGSKIEIETFTAESYPEAAKRYPYLLSRVVGRTPATRSDLAIIKLIAPNKPADPIRIYPKRGEKKGFAGLSLGCEGGKAPTCQLIDVKGKKFVKKQGQVGGGYFWQSKQVPLKGRSGGPLIDRKGFLRGICSISGGGSGYYAHVDEIHRLIRDNDLTWLVEKE